LDGSCATIGFAGQFEIVKYLQESRQPATDHRVIVNKHDADGL
jgi:hypothetical protein